MAIKLMMNSFDLRNGRDYFFAPHVRQENARHTRVYFKDAGVALMATMRWFASDYYHYGTLQGEYQ